VARKGLIWTAKPCELGQLHKPVGDAEKNRVVPPKGFEPLTHRLRSDCSTTELRRPYQDPIDFDSSRIEIRTGPANDECDALSTELRRAR
jgi:hypothetical protein